MSDITTARQRMIFETMKMLYSGKLPSEITVADITKRASVGNGMVNYHFQSKESLINEAIKEINVQSQKTLAEKLMPYRDALAEVRLSAIVKEFMNCSVNNTDVCKIAILNDLLNDTGMRHILYNFDMFNDCINELCENNPQLIWLKKFALISFINCIHLKANTVKNETGFDLYNKKKRDELIDIYIHDLFR